LCYMLFNNINKLIVIKEMPLYRHQIGRGVSNVCTA
jgi:hypothetical protein